MYRRLQRRVWRREGRGNDPGRTDAAGNLAGRIGTGYNGPGGFVRIHSRHVGAKGRKRRWAGALLCGNRWKLPVLVSLDSVDRVSVSYEDTMHVLEKDGYQIDGKEAGQERFQEYYGTLLDIPLTGAAEEISREEKEPVLVIRYDRTDEEATAIFASSFSAC